MDGPTPREADGYYHPRSEPELQSLVRLARARGASLRVRGSLHSIPGAIHTDGRLAGTGRDIDVSLDRYTCVTFDDARRRVTVQAGCRLGDDPGDPTGLATFQASLVAQLDARGWALPDLGGVTHQTVSGFLMTGSCGGTVRYSNEDAVVAFRFIDGEGNICEVERDRDDLFDAFACSMGLLGVVSTVTFACVDRYDLVGRATVTSDDAWPTRLSGPGTSPLESFFRETDYARLMWWPQAGVERVVTWQARLMTDADYTHETGPRGALRPRPYDQIGTGLTHPRLRDGASQVVQWMGGKAFDAMARARHLARRIERRAPATARLVGPLRSAFTSHVLPRILGQFVPLDTEGQRFWDTWWHGLPMDNQMSESSLPTSFTEIWVPLEATHEVMSSLRAHFRKGGFSATGAFLFEIYAARASRYWMHPGHGRDSLRIDVFWFDRNGEDPVTTFFPQFWELLAPFGYRLHWGKYLPADGGASYLRKQYPRWDDFLRARTALDPGDVFLNAHFRKALGL